MSGIVIRCPNCGTTQSTLDECEACHEATTRWFCPNHEPGLWLDAPLCPTCGARPGVPGRRARPTPAPTPTRSASPPRAAPPPRRAPMREAAEHEEWSGPVYSPREPRGPVAGSGGEPDPWRIDPSVVLPTEMRVVTFGCLRRLVITAFVLLLLAALAFYALFGVGGLLYGSAAPMSPARYPSTGVTVAPNSAPSDLRYALAVAVWPMMNRDTKRNTGL